MQKSTLKFLKDETNIVSGTLSTQLTQNIALKNKQLSFYCFGATSRIILKSVIHAYNTNKGKTPRSRYRDLYLMASLVERKFFLKNLVKILEIFEGSVYVFYSNSDAIAGLVGVLLGVSEPLCSNLFDYEAVALLFKDKRKHTYYGGESKETFLKWLKTKLVFLDASDELSGFDSGKGYSEKFDCLLELALKHQESMRNQSRLAELV